MVKDGLDTGAVFQPFLRSFSVKYRIRRGDFRHTDQRLVGGQDVVVEPRCQARDHGKSLVKNKLLGRVPKIGVGTHRDCAKDQGNEGTN